MTIAKNNTIFFMEQNLDKTTKKKNPNKKLRFFKYF